MYEVLALVVGSGIGFGLRHTPTGRAVAVAAVAAVLVGFAVSRLSGELELSAGFLIFDTGQVFLAAIAVRGLARAWLRRRAASTG